MRGMFVFFLFVACFHDYDVFDTTRVGGFESQRKRLPALCRPLMFCSSSPSRFRSEIRNIDLLLTKLFIPAASSFVAIILLSMLESRLCPLSVYPNPCSVRSFFSSCMPLTSVRQALSSSIDPEVCQVRSPVAFLCISRVEYNHPDSNPTIDLRITRKQAYPRQREETTL